MIRGTVVMVRVTIRVNVIAIMITLSDTSRAMVGRVRSIVSVMCSIIINMLRVGRVLFMVSIIIMVRMLCQQGWCCVKINEKH